MGVSRDEFLKQLAATGIVPADVVQELGRGSTPGSESSEPLAKDLVRRKLLTAYQAQQLYAGKGKALVLGNYLILEKLGQGGMGLVLKAQHRRMDRIVALKILSPAVTKDAQQLARFQREVKAAAKLEHPNIVTAYDADEADGRNFFVMQYVAGIDLAALVKKDGPLSPEHAVACTLQAARGLGYAHKRGVIHRDIKPANLLLDTEGTVKVLDMGLARIEGAVGPQAQLTDTGAVMGTVDYMAPEQALSTKTADARCDVYSLGITLWYLLVGQPTYGGPTLTARLMAHQNHPIPSLTASLPASAAGSSVSPAKLDAVFQKMVAKSPQDRYQSMEEVMAALEDCLPTGRAGLPGPVGRQAAAADASLSQLLKTPDSSTSLQSPSVGSGTVTATIVTPRSDGGKAPAKAHSGTVTTPETAINADTVPVTRAESAEQLPTRSRRWLIIGGLAAAGLVVVVGIFLLPPWAPGQGGRGNGETAIGTGQTGGQIQTVNGDLKEGSEQQGPAEGSPARLRFTKPFAHLTVPSFSSDLRDGLTAELWITDGPRNYPAQLFRAEVAGGTFGCFLLRGKRGERGLGKIYYTIATTNPMKSFNEQTTYQPTASPFHVAGVWNYVDGKMIQRLYVNGQLSAFNRYDQPRSKRLLADYRLCGIGQNGGNLTLHQARISKGIRYSNAFTPPDPLVDDESTQVLYVVNRNTGSVVKDLSGNHRDGRIEGGEWVSVP